MMSYSKDFNPPDDSYFIILTHGHATIMKLQKIFILKKEISLMLELSLQNQKQQV